MKAPPPRKRSLRVVLVSLPFRYFPNLRGSRINYTRPPLGIAYLAAYLREKAQVPVQVRTIDLLTEPDLGIMEVRDLLLGMQPDVVGMTVLTASQPFAAGLTRQLKEARPDLWVVAGGPHITALPAEPIPGIDARVVGEGEESLLEFIQEVVMGGGTRPIPGIVRTLADGTVQEGPPRPLIKDLDSLPFPARDLLPSHTYYHSFPYRGVRGFTTLFTSRGCPHDCSFCANKILWGRRVRYHGLDRVMAEVDHVVVEHGVNLLFFDDDSLFSRRGRALELMERIRLEQPGLKWICHARVDEIDDRIAREMKASGCVEVQVGIEAGDPDVLARTGKGIDLEQARSALAVLRARGINVWATFVLGHGTDTRETIDKTTKEAIRLDPTYASFIVLLPFPGTRAYEDFKAKGYLRTNDWSDYTWHGTPIFETEHLSREDLVQARARANLAFYLRPGKLAELGWLTLRAASFREMWRNLAAWKSLVGQVRFPPGR